jgi:hypothetical protein
MKKLIILSSLFIICSALSAQDEEFRTIFQKDDRSIRISGFGGPMMAFTGVGDNFAHMMGGGGGVIINNFFIGGYGMGMTTPITYKGYEHIDPGETSYYLGFGHGGFWTGYTFGSRKPVHLSLSALIGWGEIAQIDKELDYSDYETQNGEMVFVFTPVAEIELNFSKFFKMGIGSTLPFVMGPGIDETPYTTTDFLVPSIFLSFKFGWFY